MPVTVDDQQRISAAIAEAEKHTSGEIFCILSTERHRYAEWIIALAAISAFLLPWLVTMAGFGPERWAHLFGLWPGQSLAERLTVDIFTAGQALTFLALLLLLWWSPLASRLAPRRLRQERLHELALRQFVAHNIHATRQRTGVLIFVSLEDHVVEVIADKGIYAKVQPEHWADTVAALVEGLRHDRPAEGFLAAIALAGEVLARHFPPQADNPDELANHLIVL